MECLLPALYNFESSAADHPIKWLLGVADHYRYRLCRFRFALQLCAVMLRTFQLVFAGLLATLLFLLFAASCDAQSVSSYVFASSYTGASLADRDARTNLDSFEQSNATAVADRIACSMTRLVRITDSVGLYDTSAENSFLVRTDLVPADAEYLGSLLARYAHQRFVLVFQVRQGGSDHLWIVRSTQPWDAVAALARKLQVVPLTITAEGTTNLYIVDFGSKLADRVRSLVSQLRAGSETVEGAAELLGDPDRTKAMALFERKIQSAEKANGRHLSSNLWTRPWHDATSRTCGVGAH
jgi:hypothetical protein